MRESTGKFPLIFKERSFYKIDKKKIKFTQKDLQFITLVSDVALLGGKLSFKVRVTKSQHLKIGFCKKLQEYKDGECFCDFEDGFAYYNKGFSRNDSAFAGLLYGPDLFEKGDYDIVSTIWFSKGIISFD